MSETTSLSFSELHPKMALKGVVKRIELAGALIDVGTENPALLHISQLKPGRVNNVRDVLTEDQEITVWVRNIDTQQERVTVTMIKPPDVSWGELSAGQVYSGKVVRIEKFGVFVDIGAERPGLVHISELANEYIEKPEDVVSKADVVDVKVIGVNRRKNQIDLSMKALEEQKQIVEVAPEEEEEEMPTAIALAYQRALSTQEDEQASAESSDSKPSKHVEQDDIIRRTLEQHSSAQESS